MKKIINSKQINFVVAGIIALLMINMLFVRIVYASESGVLRLPPSLQSFDFERDNKGDAVRFQKGELTKKLRQESAFWMNYKSIVFLSEQDESDTNQNIVPFAKILGQIYPKIKILAADYLEPKNEYSANGNVHFIVADNTSPFSEILKKNEGFPFDALIMNRGLCVCNDPSHTCGGINVSDGNDNNMIEFLSQVIKSVNWKNHKAFTFLEGGPLNRDTEEKQKMLKYKDLDRAIEKKWLVTAKTAIKKAAGNLSKQLGFYIIYANSMEGDRVFKGILLYNK